MRLLISVAALLLATPVLAQSAGSTATLVSADKAPARVIIDGATWRCEGAVCVANGGANQPAARACRRAVAKLGAVSAFTHRGVALSAAELAACNA